MYFRRYRSRDDLRDYSDDRIAISISFDIVSRAMTAKTPARKCAARSEYLLRFFLLSIVVTIALSS